MIVYRAETVLAMVAKDNMSHPEEARSLIQQLLRTEADLIPDEKEKTLTVRLHPLATTAANRTVKMLADQLNETKTLYPGTDLRICYELVAL